MRTMQKFVTIPRNHSTIELAAQRPRVVGGGGVGVGVDLRLREHPHCQRFVCLPAGKYKALGNTSRREVGKGFGTNSYLCQTPG